MTRPEEEKKSPASTVPKATHGWAVMYGSLFLFFVFVYPSNPSCYIGRRQQMSRGISHRAGWEKKRKSHTIRGAQLHRATVSHIKGFERWRECLVSLGLYSGPTRVAGSRKPLPRAISNGAGRRYENKHTSLLIILLAKRITQVQQWRTLRGLEKDTSTFLRDGRKKRPFKQQ